VSTYEDFDELKVLIEIEGELVAETPIRIGSGRGQARFDLVDNPVLRIQRFKNGQLISEPYIPGSSLKGVFRAECEIIGKSLLQSGKLRNPNINELLDGIFGSQELASHIVCFDAYPANNKTVKTFVKPGIRINRTLGSVHYQGLFTEEFIVPGAIFSFKMTITNIDLDKEDDDRSKILNKLLKKLKDYGVQIGGRKTIGAGLVRLRKGVIRRYILQDGELRKVSEKEL